MTQPVRTLESEPSPPDSDPLRALELVPEFQDFYDESTPTKWGYEYLVTERVLRIDDLDLALSAHELTRHLTNLEIKRFCDVDLLKQVLLSGQRIVTLWQALFESTREQSRSPKMWVRMLGAACIIPLKQVGHERRMSVEWVTIDHEPSKRDVLFEALILRALYQTPIGRKNRPLIPARYPVEIHLYEKEQGAILERVLTQRKLTFRRVNGYTVLIQP